MREIKLSPQLFKLIRELLPCRSPHRYVLLRLPGAKSVKKGVSTFETPFF